MEYYSTEKINDHITLLRSITGELLYLVEGQEKAALIDTCLGVGHLRSLVEKLTDKELLVLLTHGHIDHALGAPEFDRVYMNHNGSWSLSGPVSAAGAEGIYADGSGTGGFRRD